MAGSGGTKACRLCLVTDSNLLAVDIQLENSMRSILGQNISYESGLPKYACDECAAFLRRFKEFREKCLIAQTVLYNILKSTGQVTETELNKLNRKRLKLVSSTSPMPQEDIPSPASHQEEEPCEIESVNIKEEPELEMDVEEETESEKDIDEDKSNVQYEQFESESEVLHKTHNPLEEHTYIKKEISLPAEEADMSEGFTVSIPPLLTPKIEVEIDEMSDHHSAYHCDECCRRAAGEDAAACPHPAGSCPFEFGSGNEYRDHSTEHRTYNCRTCPFSATNVEDAREHRQQEHKNKMYRCPYCNYRTMDGRPFGRHARARHARQLACGVCGACFDNAPGLHIHQGRVHHITRNILTSMKVKKKLKKKTKGKVEMNTKGEIFAEPHLLCSQCGIQFSTEAAWRRHLDNGHHINDAPIEQKKKRKMYRIENLEKAFQAAKNKEMNIRTAARTFGIPRTTLHYALANGSVSTKMGPDPIFNKEEEQILVNHVINEGHLSPKSVLEKAAQLTKKLKREKFFKNGVPEKSWYSRFLNRHPELKKYGSKGK